MSVSCDRSEVSPGFLHQKNWSPRSLQSQESLNRPVFVLDSLNRVLTILNITEYSEHYWTCAEHILNITEYSEQSLNILNMDWTESEQIVNITDNSKHRLNRFWTLLNITKHVLNITEHYWKFWTWTEHCWKFWTDSFLIKFFIFSIKSIYFISFLAHLTQRVMWAILITWRPSYVVNFFKNLLLWKY